MVHKVATSGNTASNTLSINTEDIHDGLCRQVLVYPASSDTTYDLNVVDANDRVIREYNDVTFKINDLNTFPVSGMHTLNVNNASADELFTFYLGIEEIH